MEVSRIRRPVSTSTDVLWSVRRDAVTVGLSAMPVVFFPSSIHGNIEMPIAPMIDPLSRANTPNPSSELQVPDSTASLRRAIPGKIGETRSPSLAVAAQYVFVIAAICSRPTSGSGWR
ncbi:hypothetical protein [Burkholderia stagnalis]|uniref:hypothetical protein n=1 Tax=Burkholderia stagnalis TaxID=1503054 RepID=UPI002EDB9EB1